MFSLYISFSLLFDARLSPRCRRRFRRRQPLPHSFAFAFIFRPLRRFAATYAACQPIFRFLRHWPAFIAAFAIFSSSSPILILGPRPLSFLRYYEAFAELPLPPAFVSSSPPLLPLLSPYADFFFFFSADYFATEASRQPASELPPPVSLLIEASGGQLSQLISHFIFCDFLTASASSSFLLCRFSSFFASLHYRLGFLFLRLTDFSSR